MSFKPYTEKIKKKKIEICSILGRIHHPGSGSADPDPHPHQNDTDPKHWYFPSFGHLGSENRHTCDLFKMFKFD